VLTRIRIASVNLGNLTVAVRAHTPIAARAGVHGCGILRTRIIRAVLEIASAIVNGRFVFRGVSLRSRVANPIAGVAFFVVPFGHFGSMHATAKAASARLNATTTR
jgi:hypothetical protein